MSEPLKRVVIPPECLGWTHRLGLQAWVAREGWSPGPRYAVVSAARQGYIDDGQLELADDPETIVNSIFVNLLKDDRELLTYICHGLLQVITSKSDWREIALAYAWTVLQRYNKDLGGPSA